MRYLLIAVVVLGCRKPSIEVRPDDKTTAGERVKCSIPDGEKITTAVTVPARCDLTIGKLLHVERGASLDIGAGAKLSFAKGAGIVVDGGALRARGTAAEPIVFTSAESKHAPGDWAGLSFVRATTPLAADASPTRVESVLEHALVEFAIAGVFVRPEHPVSLAHLKIQQSSGLGLFVETDDDVKRLDAIKFVDNGGGSADLPVALAVSLGDPGDAVRLHGPLKHSVTLPKLAHAYIVQRRVAVQAVPGAPVTLTIADGTVVRFMRDQELSLHGMSATASLVAHNVTFTSATDKPIAGDWGGVTMSGDVAVELDGIVIEFAGATKSKLAAIRLPSDEKKIKIVNSTFRNNGGPALRTWSSSCARWEDPTLKNTSAGKPLCEEDPIPKISLGILGALSSPSLSKGLFDDEPVGMIGSLDGPGYGGGVLGGGGGGTIAKKSSVVTESSVTATGGLPTDVVRKVVRGQTASLRSCHSGSTASGSITVTFTIDAKGSVTTASASSFGDASVASCVTSVFKGMSFPQAESGGSTSATATHVYAL
jgi:hypothetical protein